MQAVGWIELISNLGLAVTLVIVLLVWIRVWINAMMKQFLQREERMAARLDGLEAEYRNELKKALSDSTAATQEGYRCQRSLTKAITQLFQALRVKFNLTEKDLEPHPSPLGPYDPTAGSEEDTREHRQ